MKETNNANVLDNKTETKIHPIQGQALSHLMYEAMIRTMSNQQEFTMVYSKKMIDIIFSLNGKEQQLWWFIAMMMDKNTNMLHMTVDMLVEVTKISRSTVKKTLKLLQEFGAVKRRRGCIFVNSKIIHSTNATRANELFKEFSDFKHNV